MTFSADNSRIVDLWLETRVNPHTRDCYRRDAMRLVAHAAKPLTSLTLRDLQSFVQSLSDSGLAPVSRLRSIAAIRSLFAFCHRMRFIDSNPAAELPLPAYETPGIAPTR